MDIERLKELQKQVSGIVFIALSILTGKEARANTVKFGEDLQELIDAAIARQSATSDDVQRAIEQLQSEYVDDFEGYSASCERWNRNIDTAIAALQSYEPTTRKDRIVEDRLPTEDDADDYGRMLFLWG